MLDTSKGCRRSPRKRPDAPSARIQAPPDLANIPELRYWDVLANPGTTLEEQLCRKKVLILYEIHKKRVSQKATSICSGVAIRLSKSHAPAKISP